MSLRESDAPPSYDSTTAFPSSSSSSAYHTSGRQPYNDTSAPSTPDRPLPSGWTRRFDPTTSLPFFVDTAAHPPRSIWVHPYDDELFLSSCNEKERAQIRSLSEIPNRSHTTNPLPPQRGEKGDARQHERTATTQSHATVVAPTYDAQEQNEQTTGTGLGSRLKSKLTGTSHDARTAERAERDAAKAFAKDNHAAILRALAEAKDTGHPAHVGRDVNGHDVFVEPPEGYSATPQMALPDRGMMKGKGRGVKVEKGMEMGMGRGFGIRAGYDPYRDENARFIAPLEKDKRGVGPRGESGWGYGREYRYGYGYGYGGMGMMGMGMMGFGGMGTMGGMGMGMGMGGGM